jgi:hypothetical protein
MIIERYRAMKLLWNYCEDITVRKYWEEYFQRKELELNEVEKSDGE